MAVVAADRDSYRYEKQLQAEEEAYQQARRRLYQEIQDEKERLSQQATRQRQEMDKLQQKLEETHTTSSDIMRRDYEKIRQEQDERHKVRVATGTEVGHPFYYSTEIGRSNLLWRIGREVQSTTALR